MSLFATINFAINLGKFRNIDLLQNGYYKIRCRLYYLNDGISCPALPKNIIYMKNQNGNIKYEGIEEDGSTISRPFIIRYIDDVVDISETILFSCDVRLELPNMRSFKSFFNDISYNETNDLTTSTFLNGKLSICAFFLEIDLLYSELCDDNILIDSESVYLEESSIDMVNCPKNEEFKSVCYNVYRINNVSNGIVEYIPITFDEFHFCSIGCVIITQITRIFVSNDNKYSRTIYIPRYNIMKPIPMIPSFLLYNDNDNKSDENDKNMKETVIKSNESNSKLIEHSLKTSNNNLKDNLNISNYLNNNNNMFTIRNIIIQKMSQLNISSNIEIDNNKKNEEKIMEYNNKLENEKNDSNNNNVEKIRIDEVFPSIMTRDPIFLEASRLRIELITVLTNIYLQLAANIHFITKKCCSLQRAKLMGSFLRVPSWELPGGSKLNVEPLINIKEFLFEDNGASIPFYVIREQEESINENLMSRTNSEIELKEENEFKHSLTISSYGTTIGIPPEQRITDSALCFIKLPTTIWSLTPLNWQINYKRGITPPLFKRNTISQSINFDSIINNEPISAFQTIIEAPYGISQYSCKINMELENLSTQLSDIWNHFITIFPFVINKLEQICKMENIRKTMHLWNETIFIETLSINEYYQPSLKPEPSNFPEFIGNNTFPITPPILLSICSSSTGCEIINKKNSGIFSVIPQWVSGNTQNSSIFFMKSNEYYSKIADKLRNDFVFKSIPSPTCIEEICLPFTYEGISYEEQSINKQKSISEDKIILLSTEFVNSSKYNEWLPILFIQRYTSINNNQNSGGILTHCGQLCRVGLNNDPEINAKNIVSRKIEIENKKKSYNPPSLFNDQLFGQENIDETPKIPIKTELPFNETNKEETIRDLHIIIFVHGLQGSAFDMRNVRNIISFYYPEVLCLLSTSNEDYTDGPIQDMGKRLSEEIITAITPFSKTLKKLSFIGHSLGGIIIRAALPHLYMFTQYFFLYWSLSTPHLGCVCNNSKLINAGVWIMKKWSSSQSLNELTLSDASKYEETFIYKLAIESSQYFSYFKHIIFCSSHQDMYAPYDSARAEYSTDAPLIYKSMVESILKHIHPSKLIRIDVNFHLPQKNLDTFIGRAAHIQVIENHLFIKILVTRFPEWFII